jgi:catechol 2,3-dioxygenase-like lactoylglutathione lyase family enzyme
MLHHVSLGVRDIEASARFYDAVLSILGYDRVWSDLRPGQEGQAVGYGYVGGGDKLALKQRNVGGLASGPVPFGFCRSEQSGSGRILRCRASARRP